MTPLDWICFTALVRVSSQVHESYYRTSEGWTILEVEPGRVWISHADKTKGEIVAVDGVPYSCVEARAPVEPPPETRPDSPRTDPKRKRR